MKAPLVSIVSILVAIAFHGFSHASTPATCLVYQPIDMRSEGTVIHLPEQGFIILPVPYLSAFSVPEKPYDAITRPHSMLAMPLQHGDPDSNLVSRAGITIQSACMFEGDKLKEEVVSVDFSRFESKDYEPSLDVIAEATLECIRRTATDEHQKWLRPVLKIIGKPTDEARWKRWEDAFNQQDFSKPFRQPEAPAVTK
ncbi:MAG: hypothetical protein V4819_14635 [Verrucomicrobiota bacterium]